MTAPNHLILPPPHSHQPSLVPVLSSLPSDTLALPRDAPTKAGAPGIQQPPQHLPEPPQAPPSLICAHLLPSAPQLPAHCWLPHCCSLGPPGTSQRNESLGGVAGAQCDPQGCHPRDVTPGAARLSVCLEQCSPSTADASPAQQHSSTLSPGNLPLWKVS